MMRLAELSRGMRVVTPLNLTAKVMGTFVDPLDPESIERVSLRYLDPALGLVELQARVLRPYVGPPVVFQDELDQLHYKHDVRPLSVRHRGPGE